MVRSSLDSQGWGGVCAGGGVASAQWRRKRKWWAGGRAGGRAPGALALSRSRSPVVAAATLSLSSRHSQATRAPSRPRPPCLACPLPPPSPHQMTSAAPRGGGSGGGPAPSAAPQPPPRPINTPPPRKAAQQQQRRPGRLPKLRQDTGFFAPVEPVGELRERERREGQGEWHARAFCSRPAMPQPPTPRPPAPLALTSLLVFLSSSRRRPVLPPRRRDRPGPHRQGREVGPGVCVEHGLGAGGA